MPIPLAMMIPFMATQSLVMGHAFGEAFQYGKRKISAMSNEEFNKYTPKDMADGMFVSYKMILPSLKESINDSTELQNFIVAKLLDMPREIFGSLFGAVGGDGETPPVSDPHKFLSAQEKTQHFIHGHGKEVGFETAYPPSTEPVNPPRHPGEEQGRTKTQIILEIDNKWRSIRATMKLINDIPGNQPVGASHEAQVKWRDDKIKAWNDIIATLLNGITRLKNEYKTLFGSFPPKSQYAL